MVTNIAAAAGAVGAMATTWLKDGKPNLGMTLNGAIAGLVAITAGCGNMTFGGGFLAGLVGGIIVVFSIEFIDKVLKIDDAVGAASAHGVVGAWGTLVIGLWGVDGDAGIGLFNGGGGSQFGIQAIGVLAYGVWATVTALIGFGILKSTIGLRVSEEVEIKGLDEAEHGIGGFDGGGFEAWIKQNTK
jgi:Amt family ammonium transporter